MSDLPRDTELVFRRIDLTACYRLMPPRLPLRDGNVKRRLSEPMACACRSVAGDDSAVAF